MRALKALVIGMGVLIVIAVVVLIVGVMNRSDKSTAAENAGPGAVPPTSFSPQSILLPPGAEISETRIGDGRVVLRLALPGGNGRLIVLDADTGQITGTVDLKTQ